MLGSLLAPKMAMANGGRFLAYLPHDNSIGGNPDAESVVQAINDELEDLLASDDATFWGVADRDASLQACLDSYLRFQRHVCFVLSVWLGSDGAQRACKKQRCMRARAPSLPCRVSTAAV